MRHVASLALLLAFPVLLLGLVGGLLVGGVAVGAPAGIKIVLAGVAVALAVAYTVRSGWGQQASPPPGPRLHRTEHPDLWTAVDDVADQAATRSPDEIILVPEVNAAVSEETSRFGLATGQRYLLIGLPLLAGLTVQELRAVLGHEMGHFSRGDTRLGSAVYRYRSILLSTSGNLDHGPVRWLLAGYARLYALVSAGANRHQEENADRIGVAVAGRAAMSSALIRLDGLHAAWSAFEDRYLACAVMAERTPPLLPGFQAFSRSPRAARDPRQNGGRAGHLDAVEPL